MKKWLLQLVSLLVVIGLITGCGSDKPKEESTINNNSTEQNESVDSGDVQETVVITISKDEGAEIIAEKEVPIKEDEILMDVLKENFEIDDKAGYITSIEGIAPEEDEQKAWMYFVNDEMAPVGANEFKLTPGDKVTFDLQAWE